MKARYRLIRRGNRGGAFYCVDSETGKRSSLGAVTEDEARQIVEAKKFKTFQDGLAKTAKMSKLAAGKVTLQIADQNGRFDVVFQHGVVFGGVTFTPGDWLYALPFAAAWLLSMVFLYACFALIGPVFGNILQSTRGILSIVLGAGLARLGVEHLEERVPRAVLLQRIGAALLMCIAVWLFQTGRR